MSSNVLFLLRRAAPLLALGVIVALAFWLRVYHIGTVPAGIYPDEAQNGFDAFLAQRDGAYRWFYPDNNGREGLYINLIALAFKAFGVSILTFKLASIVIGTLTVLGVYLLGREVFWRWRHAQALALLAAFFVAVSFWHINFSRIGFRAILLPLVLTFAFWLLLRGLRRIKAGRGGGWSFFLGGAVFGLGLHTYIAFRIAPAALIVLFVALLLARRFALRALLAPAALFLAGTLLTAAPMLWTFYTHPDMLSSRTADVSIFSPANNHGDLLGALAHNLALSFGMFTVWGDQNWRHGYPTYPTLEPITGAFFLLGLATSLVVSARFFLVALWHIVRRRHAPSSHRPTWPSVHLFLLAWFVLMLAPAFLSAEGLPHALRSIGALPVVYLFAALGVGVMWRAADMHRVLRLIFYPFLALYLVYAPLFGFAKYHLLWAQEPQMAAAFNKNLTDIARAVAAAPGTTQKVVIVGPLERLPVRLLNTHTANLTFLYPHEIAAFVPHAPHVIVYMTDCPRERVSALRARLGGGTLTEHTARLRSHYCTLSR